jgi:uncharacterized protein YjbI with pentapeptide repeats
MRCNGGRVTLCPIDESNQHLERANLKRANLKRANLKRANLKRANLKMERTGL